MGSNPSFGTRRLPTRPPARSLPGAFSSGVLALALGLILSGCGDSSPTRPSGDGWLFERVDAGWHNGFESGLTTTTDGSVHIAYHDADLITLRYAVRSPAGVWAISRPDSIGWLGRFPAVYASAGDTLNFAYQDTWADDLKYARLAGGVWQEERVDPQYYTGTVPEFAEDGGTLLLADLDLTRDRFAMRRREGGTWVRSWDFSVQRMGYSMGFTMGPSGPRLAIYSGTGGRGTPTDEGTIFLFSPSGTVTSFTRTELAYGRYSSGSLAAAYDDSGSLHVLVTERGGTLHDFGHEAVTTGVAYGTVRIRKGADGTLWTLYPVKGGLGLSARPPGGTWERRSILGGLDPEGRWDLHVDDGGVVHVSVYSSHYRLWYGRWEGPS